MNTCDACVFWSKSLDHGVGHEAGICTNDLFQCYPPARPDAMAARGPNIPTGPKFGCIQFQAYDREFLRNRVLKKLTADDRKILGI